MNQSINESRYALVADLGGTKIAAARVSTSGRISHLITKPTPREGGWITLQALLEVLGSLPRHGAIGVGVAVPGLVYAGGKVWAPNVPGWERMPLGSALKKHFKLPAVVDSDRNAFVAGEAWKGAARNCRDVVFVAVGTGIGAGIISGGRLLRGHAELAGCLGWVTVRRPDNDVGSAVNAESSAGGLGIARAATEAWGKPMTARDVVTLARRGDRRAIRFLAGAGHDLGVALAGIVSILNPEMIVIGGGVASAGSLLLKPASGAMRRLAQPIAARQVRIVRSKLGGRAGLLGIARLAFAAHGGPALE